MKGVAVSTVQFVAVTRVQPCTVEDYFADRRPKLPLIGINGSHQPYTGARK